ncbi:MAG TPA: HEAT repeat domain-containing protein [Bryobacteraceae bacterium]|jgi:HEAT repeat protein
MVQHLSRLMACALLASFAASGQSDETSVDANQRIDTIRNLGKRDYTVIPTIAQYLKDPSRDVRIEAIKAIVRIDTVHSLDALVEATRDHDAEAQIRATDGIVNAYLPGYVAKSGLTGSATRGVRQVKSFFSSRNYQVVDADLTIRPDVAQALGDEIRGGAGLDAKANAARAAGILRAGPAVPALVQASHSKDSELIFECLVALQKIHDTSAGPGIGFLARDLDERIQVTALETIGVLRSLPSAPDVRSALTHARDTRIRRAALEALAMLAIPDDRGTFQKYAQNDDAGLRAAALEGLGRIREPEDYPALEAAYNEKDADWRIHLAAAFALVNEGKVDTSEFSPLPYLVETLNSGSRAYAANAYLVELARRKDVRDSLVKLLPETTKEQKIALCSVFGKSQADDAVPILNGLTKDMDPDVAFAASRALRIIQARRPPEKTAGS